MTNQGRKLIDELSEDAVDRCKCGHELGEADIGGGRCTGCGTMILPRKPFLVTRLEIHEQIVAVNAESPLDAQHRVAAGEGDKKGDATYAYTHDQPDNWSVETVEIPGCFEEKPHITYRELAEQIGRMTDAQKDSDVTIHDETIDEFFPVTTFVSNWLDNDPADGVLDDDHPYLGCKA